MRDDIDGFLRQPIDESSSLKSARDALIELCRRCAAQKQALAAAAGPVPVTAEQQEGGN